MDYSLGAAQPLILTSCDIQVPVVILRIRRGSKYSSLDVVRKYPFHPGDQPIAH